MAYRLSALFPALLPLLLSGPMVLAQKPSFAPFEGSFLATPSRTLPLSQAGSFNTALVSQGDLDNDGLKETILFDRENRKVTVLERLADGTWKWKPELELLMPQSADWLIVKDFNGDNLPDVFAGEDDYVKLFKNIGRPTGQAKFILLTEALMSTSLSGTPLELTIARTDIPSIVDADGDGDLDVICFTYAGSTVELHRNLSIEESNNLEDIHFRKEPCWGRFSESPTQCNVYALGLTCRVGDDGSDPQTPQVPNHIGSTLTAFDYDYDGDYDLMIGDVTCNDLNLLLNGGTRASANITEVQSVFPLGTRQASFNLFPVGSEADLNGDGRMDFVASSNQPGNDFDAPTNFRKSAWAYLRNPAGSASPYAYLTNEYWQEDMGDMGAHAAPALCDVNADGVPDLVVGHSDRLGGTSGLYGALMLWLGRPRPGGLPEFVLTDTLFLNVQAPSNEPVIALAADWNRDGIQDLGYLQTLSSGQAQFTWFVGQATAGTNGYRFDFSAPQTGLMNAPFTFGDAPCFVDVDNDDDLDLVLGREDGNLALYTNTGTGWQLVTNSFLGVSTSFARLSVRPAVADFDGNGQLDVFTTDQRGRPRLYRNVAFVAGFTTPADTLLGKSDATGEYLMLKPGRWGYPVAAHLDGDNLPDLIIGTGGGGIQLWRNTAAEPLSTRTHLSTRLATLSPNPSSALGLHPSKAATVTVTNALGQQVAGWSLVPGEANPRLEHLPKGLYLVTVRSGEEMQVLRWVKE